MKDGYDDSQKCCLCLENSLCSRKQKIDWHVFFLLVVTTIAYSSLSLSLYSCTSIVSTDETISINEALIHCDGMRERQRRRKSGYDMIEKRSVYTTSVVGACFQ